MRYLKYGNKLVFKNSLEMHLMDLHYTKGTNLPNKEYCTVVFIHSYVLVSSLVLLLLVSFFVNCSSNKIIATQRHLIYRIHANSEVSFISPKYVKLIRYNELQSSQNCLFLLLHCKYVLLYVTTTLFLNLSIYLQL